MRLYPVSNRIERRLGSGSYGHVWLAWDAQNAQRVAIKHAAANRRAQDRLRQEAEMLASITHPCVPTPIEWFQDRKDWYLAETWMPGMPMSRRRHYSLADVLWIGECLLDVLATLCERQIVHRDLNPNNIVLSETDLALVDFGCAAKMGTLDHIPWGTPGYIAPEQERRSAATPEADRYSLGMLLGCALTDSEPEEVHEVGGFLQLWDGCEPPETELVPLLRLFDQLIVPEPDRRPSLATFQQVMAQTEALRLAGLL